MGGRQDEEIFAALVLDQGLIEVGFLVDDIDEIVDHPPFTAHDEVQIAQADIEIDDHGAMPAEGEAHELLLMLED